MYFGGAQTFIWSAGVFGQIILTPYDFIVAMIGLLMLCFFVVTALQETFRLAKANK
jgi:hypothetical protein